MLRSRVSNWGVSCKKNFSILQNSANSLLGEHWYLHNCIVWQKQAGCLLALYLPKFSHKLTFNVAVCPASGKPLTIRSPSHAVAPIHINLLSVAQWSHTHTQTYIYVCMYACVQHPFCMPTTIYLSKYFGTLGVLP